MNRESSTEYIGLKIRNFIFTKKIGGLNFQISLIVNEVPKSKTYVRNGLLDDLSVKTMFGWWISKSLHENENWNNQVRERQNFLSRLKSGYVHGIFLQI